MPETELDDASRLTRAREVIQSAGASVLPRRPWLATRQPHSDVDLVRYVLWRSGESTGERIDTPALIAGLRLLASARGELDQLEVGLLFEARARGLTWPRIAEALGLGSAQAAQQRSERLLARVDGPTRTT